MEAVKKREERLLAALCHISIIFSTMGVIVPIVIYINARERSKPLAFQAMQSMLYHVACIVWAIVYTVAWTIIFLAFTGIFGAVVSTGPEEAFAVMFTVIMVAFVVLLFAGLFIVYVLGIVGAIQTIRGRMFKYPLIGNWLEQWLAGEND
jgi:uncharacterized Tic20 family protein